MNVVATEIPDVLIIEPRVFGDDPGDFSTKASIRRFGKRRQAFSLRLSGTTTRVLCVTSCAGSIIRSAIPRESSCGLLPERCLM